MNRELKNIYNLFFNDKVSFTTKLISIVVFMGVLQVCLYLSKENYILYYSVFIFLLFLIPAVLNDPNESNLGKFVSFIKNYPIGLSRIILNHVFYQLFSKDQLLTYLCLAIILIINGIDFFSMISFFSFLFIVLLIPVFIEYIFSLVKIKPQFLFINQVLIVFIFVTLSQFRFNFSLVWQYIQSHSAVILFIIGIFITILGTWALHNLLMTKNNKYIQNKILDLYGSILINIIKGITIKKYRNKINIPSLFIRQSLRDKIVLNKLIFVFTLSLLIIFIINSNNSMSDVQNNRLVFLIGLYYFSGIHLESGEYFKKFFRYFPIKTTELKIGKDIALGSIFLSMSYILIIVEGIITGKEILISLINLLVLYLVGLCFIVEVKNIKKVRVQISYLILSILYISIFNSYLIFSILLCTGLIILYIYKVKNNKERIQNYYIQALKN